MFLWSEEWHQAFALAEEFARQDHVSRNTVYLLIGLATAQGPGYREVFDDIDLPVAAIRDLARSAAARGRPDGATITGIIGRSLVRLRFQRPGFDDYDLAADCFLKDLDLEMRAGRVKRPFDGGHLSLTVLQPTAQAASALGSLGFQVDRFRESARRYVTTLE